jgi:mono/diheme cytochrome c family protein
VARAPAALAALAGSEGDLGRRAALVLARLEWPGKPGAAAPVAPLTPEEEGRFVAGRDLFTSACVACHQADGRGKDAMAPTLVGAPLALGPADLPTRILLNGKEGPVGLMPPLGQAFSDEQIASVLTYIRRQWGNTASAVDPAGVRATRARVTGRARPWTHDELQRMLDVQPRQESQ